MRQNLLDFLPNDGLRTMFYAGARRRRHSFAKIGPHTTPAAKPPRSRQIGVNLLAPLLVSQRLGRRREGTDLPLSKVAAADTINPI